MYSFPPLRLLNRQLAAAREVARGKIHHYQGVNDGWDPAKQKEHHVYEKLAAIGREQTHCEGRKHQRRDVEENTFQGAGEEFAGLWWVR